MQESPKPPQECCECVVKLFVTNLKLTQTDTDPLGLLDSVTKRYICAAQAGWLRGWARVVLGKKEADKEWFWTGKEREDRTLGKSGLRGNQLQ